MEKSEQQLTEEEQALRPSFENKKSLAYCIGIKFCRSVHAVAKVKVPSFLERSRSPLCKCTTGFSPSSES